MSKNRKVALGLSDNLFWDVDPFGIDKELHALFIIERVLTTGTWEDFKKALAYYGKKRMGEYATQLRYLDKLALEFSSVYFNIPRGNFRCHKKNRLHQTFWEY